MKTKVNIKKLCCHWFDSQRNSLLWSSKHCLSPSICHIYEANIRHYYHHEWFRVKCYAHHLPSVARLETHKRERRFSNKYSIVQLTISHIHTWYDFHTNWWACSAEKKFITALIVAGNSLTQVLHVQRIPNVSSWLSPVVLKSLLLWPECLCYPSNSCWNLISDAAELSGVSFTGWVLWVLPS